MNKEKVIDFQDIQSKILADKVHFTALKVLFSLDQKNQ